MTTIPRHNRFKHPWIVSRDDITAFWEQSLPQDIVINIYDPISETETIPVRSDGYFSQIITGATTIIGSLFLYIPPFPSLWRQADDN